MKFQLTDEQRDIVATVRKLAQEKPDLFLGLLAMRDVLRQSDELRVTRLAAHPAVFEPDHASVGPHEPIFIARRRLFACA